MTNAVMTSHGQCVRTITFRDAFPKTGSVDTPDIRISYRDYGGRGTPIVLLHGLASSSHIWNNVGRELARTHRVIALDQRGHGRSGKPDYGYDFASVTKDVAIVVDALGLGRPIVVGHSWGAHVALELAARRPEYVSGAVLVDGGLHSFGERPWKEIEQELTPPDLSHYTLPGLIDQVQEWGWGQFWNCEVEATLLSLFHVGPDGRVRPRLTRANHMQIVRAIWEQRLEQLYPAVESAVLILPASEVALAETPEEKRTQVRQAASLLPDARVRWFEHTSHDVPLERPTELAETIATFAAET
jgi:pimeloyl-ACP methyl ester carboxylesterase